jgi:hypothetical protein
MLIKVDEDIVLGPILRKSEEFRQFHREERQKKVGWIQWIRDFDIPDGIEAYATTFEFSIHCRKSSMSPEDAYTMAHEIMHLIRYQENGLLEIGYAQPEYEFLAVYLASMLEDPIVDSILQEKYNFDLRIPVVCRIFCKLDSPVIPHIFNPYP